MNKITATQGYGTSDINRYVIPFDELGYGNVPPTPITVATNWRGYAYTILDDTTLTVPVPVDYEVGSDMYVYLRWACNEAYALASGEVRWACGAIIMPNDGTTVIGSGKDVVTNYGEDINIPATARTVTETLVLTIPYQVIATAETMMLSFTRVVLQAGTSPTAEPEVYAAWIQYRRFRQWQP